jgi:hypothetical protein
VAGNDQAVRRTGHAFYKNIVQKTKKSVIVFVAATAVAAMFLKGMPLHNLFRPWGQALLVICALTFARALFDLSVMIPAWFDKRDRIA